MAIVRNEFRGHLADVRIVVYDATYTVDKKTQFGTYDLAREYVAHICLGTDVMNRPHDVVPLLVVEIEQLVLVYLEQQSGHQLQIDVYLLHECVGPHGHIYLGILIRLTLYDCRRAIQEHGMLAQRIMSLVRGQRYRTLGTEDYQRCIQSYRHPEKFTTHIPVKAYLGCDKTTSITKIFFAQFDIFKQRIK